MTPTSSSDDHVDADIIDCITNALPPEVRADYYRELRHCRSLPENDEMLRILRIMQYLTLLTVEVPGRIAAEREGVETLFKTSSMTLQRALESSMVWQRELDGRLRQLPEDVVRDLSPEAIAANINESLRQQFVASTIPQTGHTLAAVAAELQRITKGRRRHRQNRDAGRTPPRTPPSRAHRTCSRSDDECVEELRRVGFNQAITVERVLQDANVQACLPRGVMILDEAGMVSARQMSDLLQLAEKHDVRIIFSGDTHQIQSVAAGDALRVLERESRLKSIALTEVQRQRPKDYRQAIQELRSDPERGFARLDAMGVVEEIECGQRSEAVAKAYLGSTAKTKNVLVVCPTHEEIDRVTDAIRTARKDAGELQPGVRLTQDVSLNWATAQKSNTQNVRPGQILGFHKPVRGIGKNQTAVVVAVDDNRLTLRDDRGRERTVTRRHAKAFDVFERREIEVAISDKLLLTANRRESNLQVTNGEIVTVSNVDDHGRIRLTDGRVLPETFKQFAYGYAVTAHRSQGKTVDSVIISGDRMQKELFYVAASRGREQVRVVTSDKEQLRESVARSTARLSAIELMRRRRPGQHQDAHRGRVAGCELLRQATKQSAAWGAKTLTRTIKPIRKAERVYGQDISR